jgi:hypothetical protein
MIAAPISLWHAIVHREFRWYFDQDGILADFQREKRGAERRRKALHQNDNGAQLNEREPDGFVCVA